MCSQTLTKNLYLNRFSFLGLTTSMMVTGVFTITPPATAASLGTILTATGQVSIKRGGWTNYQPAAVGTSLDNGDLIWPAAGSQVTLQCSNGTKQPVPSGSPSGVANFCSPPQSIDDTTRGYTIAGIDPNLPYIISPRRTHLLSPTPTIRWNAVTGANSYRVRVRGGGVDWRTEVPTNQVVYSGQTPLQPGQDYLITIITDNGVNSNQDPGMQIGFTILDDSKRANLQADLTELSQQQLGEPAQTLDQAVLYQQYKLRAEAIDILESAISSNQASATVYFNLAGLYEEVRLTQLAINNYLQAFQQASDSSELVTKTEAAAKLAEIYSALKDTPQAQRFLQEAIQGYETLGDSTRMEEFKQKLQKLETQRVRNIFK